jgi:predicted RNA-binding Zn-ribbon protein involved in translation (DUF1610 family)
MTYEVSDYAGKWSDYDKQKPVIHCNCGQIIPIDKKPVDKCPKCGKVFKK